MVEREEADYGVVPVENSLEGAVARTLDRFIEFKRSPIRICGEIEQPIQHFLILQPNAKLERIRIVYSHPQALGQCRRWLEKNLPLAARRETASTAQAAEMLFLQEGLWPVEERAAIGSLELAKQRKLKTFPIPIDRENRTRFLILSLEAPLKGSRNKTALLFTLKDRPGALHDALVPFKQHGINLTKIESRPSKRKAWEYLFFIDLEGHELEPKVQRVLKALQKCTKEFQVLGSYPVSS